MCTDELTYLSALEMAALIREKSVSPLRDPLIFGMRKQLQVVDLKIIVLPTTTLEATGEHEASSAPERYR